MNNLKVSVLITAYNAERYIKECILSIINQTYRNIEIIIVDDGSTDNTIEIIKEFANLDSRIYIISQSNAGVSVARNIAKINSTGEYILYVDSDDYLKNTAIEELVNIVLTEKSDLVIFNYCEFYGNCNKPKGKDNGEIYNYTKKECLYKYICGDPNMTFIIWRKFYKKEILALVDFPKNMIPEDMATGFDFFNNSEKISYYERILYYYRVLPNSLTMVNNISKDYNKFKMYKNEYKKRLEVFPEFKSIITSKYFNSLLSSYCSFIKYNDDKKIYKMLDECKKSIDKISFKELNYKSKLLYIVYKIAPNIIIKLYNYKINKIRKNRKECKINNV